MMAPGTRALAFASRWFDPALVHRTFEPLIADWQSEWYESAPSRRPWLSIRAWAAFICSAVISSPRIIAAPTPRTISVRVTKQVTIFCVVLGGAVCISMMPSLRGREFDAPFWTGFLLVAMPAALAIVFPFAMVIAVDAIRRETNVAPHIERAAAVKLALFSLLLMLTVTSIVAPVLSQQWLRVSTPPGWNTPQPRPHQLSSLALLTHPERTTAILATPQYTRAGEIRRELWQRVITSVMPAIFVWLRWSSLGRRHRRRFWPLPTWAMTAAVIATHFGAFYLSVILEIEWGLFPGTGFVVPLLIFSLWGLLEQRAGDRMGFGQSLAHEA